MTLTLGLPSPGFPGSLEPVAFAVSGAVAWQRSQDIGLSVVASLPALAVAVVRLARWALLTLGQLVAVTITFPSLSAQSLLSTLGIGGVAIGFAFRVIFTIDNGVNLSS